MFGMNFAFLLEKIQSGGIMDIPRFAMVRKFKEFEKCFSECETRPIVFSLSELCDNNQSLELIANAKSFMQELALWNSSKAKKYALKIKRNIIALLYRLEKINGGMDKGNINKIKMNKLAKLAQTWKKENPIIINKNLEYNETIKLQECTRYDAFIDLLFMDNKLLTEFFNWAIRDNNAIAPFIEFPSVIDKLNLCALNGRIGRHGGNALVITKVENSRGILEKNLTLPIEGKPINILDGSKEIVFKGNYKLTIAQIFDVFKNKKYRVGELEFMADGIMNWNVHYLGSWDADKQVHHTIDLHLPGWWRNLPAFETLNRTQAERRYGKKIAAGEWVVAACASRGSPTLDFDQTHAYSEVAIPIHDDRYAIFNFGKFAFTFPSTFFENVAMICENVHATIAYPDENVFYTHRQHALYAFVLNPCEGFILMDSIKQDMLKSRERNFIFQIESENCAKWIYEKLIDTFGEGKVPNLFKMPLLNTEPGGVVGVIFKLIRKLPASIQTPVITFFHLFLGAARVTKIFEKGAPVEKSLTRHSFWQTAEVYLPALLNHQVLQGELADSYIPTSGF